MADKVYLAFFTPPIIVIAFGNVLPRALIQTFLLLSSALTYFCTGPILFGTGLLRTTFSQDDREYNLRFLVYCALYFLSSLLSLLLLVIYPFGILNPEVAQDWKVSVAPIFSVSWALHSYISIFTALLTYHPIEELREVVRRRRFLKDLRFKAKVEANSKNLLNKNFDEIAKLKKHVIRRNSSSNGISSNGNEKDTSDIEASSAEYELYHRMQMPVYLYTDTFNSFLQRTHFMIGCGPDEKGRISSLAWWYYIAMQFLSAFLASIALVCVDFFSFAHHERFLLVLTYLIMFTTQLDLTSDIAGKWRYLGDSSYSAFLEIPANQSFGKAKAMSFLLYFLCITNGIVAMVMNASTAWLCGVSGFAAECVMIISLFLYQNESSNPVNNSCSNHKLDLSTKESTLLDIDRFGLRVFQAAKSVLIPQLNSLWNISVQDDALTTSYRSELQNCDISSIMPKANTESPTISYDPTDLKKYSRLSSMEKASREDALPELHSKSEDNEDGNFDSESFGYPSDYVIQYGGSDTSDGSDEPNFYSDKDDQTSSTSSLEDEVEDSDSSHYTQDIHENAFRNRDYSYQDFGTTYLRGSSSSDLESLVVSDTSEHYSRLSEEEFLSDDYQSLSGADDLMGYGSVRNLPVMRETKITRITSNPYNRKQRNRSELLKRQYATRDPSDGRMTKTYHDRITSIITQNKDRCRRRLISRNDTIRKKEIN